MTLTGFLLLIGGLWVTGLLFAWGLTALGRLADRRAGELFEEARRER